MATVTQELLLGLKDIGNAFTHDLSILWLLAPIFIIWIFLEIYFGMFKSEKLGWNNALGNGVTLLWIGVDSMRYIFSAQRVGDFWLRFVVFGIMVLYSMMLIYLSLNRRLGETLTYALGSTTPIYFLSSVAVLWSYGLLKIDRWVFLDFTFIFILLLVVFYIFRRFIPQSQLDITNYEPVSPQPEEQPKQSP